jgi:hypothetical protein
MSGDETECWNFAKSRLSRARHRLPARCRDGSLSGLAGGKPDTKSALSKLLEQPFGRTWVGTIGLGLLGFVAWRLARSLAECDRHGSGSKAWAIRAALLGNALAYIGLASFAISHALSAGGGGQSSDEQGLARSIMSRPCGAYLAMVARLCFIRRGDPVDEGLTRKSERYLRLPDTKGFIRLVCI